MYSRKAIGSWVSLTAYVAAPSRTMRTTCRDSPRGSGHDELVGPLLQRHRPGQRQDRRVGPVRDEAEGHAPRLARFGEGLTASFKSPLVGDLGPSLNVGGRDTVVDLATACLGSPTSKDNARDPHPQPGSARPHDDPDPPRHPARGVHHRHRPAVPDGARRVPPRPRPPRLRGVAVDAICVTRARHACTPPPMLNKQLLQDPIERLPRDDGAGSGARAGSRTRP